LHGLVKIDYRRAPLHCREINCGPGCGIVTYFKSGTANTLESAKVAKTPKKRQKRQKSPENVKNEKNAPEQPKIAKNAEMRLAINNYRKRGCGKAKELYGRGDVDDCLD
jgi:hypothetical protein